MASEWYYQFMGQTFGPLSANEIREKTQSGNIQRDTLVRKGDIGDWFSADNVKGLFLNENDSTLNSNKILQSPPQKTPPELPLRSGNNPENQILDSSHGEKRDCPFCGETILLKAIKCRHCNEMLVASTPTKARIKKRKRGSSFLRIIGVLTFLFGIAITVKAYNMDTSVRVPSINIFDESVGGGRVENLSLANKKSNDILIGMGVSALGLVLYTLGEFLPAADP